jgi:hypothetical protein
LKTAIITDCTALWRNDELRIIAVQENSNETLEIVLSARALEILKQAVTEPKAPKLKKGAK